MREFLVPSLQDLQDLSSYSVVSDERKLSSAKRMSESASNSGDSDTDLPKKKLVSIHMLAGKEARKHRASQQTNCSKSSSSKTIPVGFHAAAFILPQTEHRENSERKEQHVKDLEREVELLRASSTSNGGAFAVKLEHENNALKLRNATLQKQVSELQAENSMLRQMTFGFDFGGSIGGMSSHKAALPAPAFVSQQRNPAAPLQTVPPPFASSTFGFSFPDLTTSASPNSLVRSPASMSSMSTSSSTSTDLASFLGSTQATQKPFGDSLDFTNLFPAEIPALDLRNVPIDVNLDSFMFDNQDWLNLSGSTTAALSKPATSSLGISASASNIVKILDEDAEGCSLSQLPDVSCLKTALKSIASLKDKGHMVDDMCDTFQEYISRHTTAILDGKKGPECPLEVYKKKLAIIESCQGSATDSQLVLSIFAVAKDKYCAFLDKAVMNGLN
ncbi:hypothetical protein HDU81_005331 [Chytriomyces hyalinus]|nr:hypothetical protein HDU81_005331 [Chytriomyces hyalinus]